MKDKLKDYKGTLFPYAYNVLGSAEDAMDAVQDVLVNHIDSPKAEVENEKNYLIKSVINRAIDLKKRKRKLKYDHVWLPEPMATEESDTNINLKDIVSYSMLMLMERLNPRERAVFILKEAFGYTHEEIAEVISSTVELSRKLLSRAKVKLETVGQSEKPFEKKAISYDFVEHYINAIRERDLARLENLLSEDIIYKADGGRARSVVKESCTGAHQVAELLIYIYHQFQFAFQIIKGNINHQPALLYFKDTELKACQVFLMERGKVKEINLIIDPEKLTNLFK